MLGTYRSRVFDEGAAEIVSYHAPSRRLFVVNAMAGTLDVLDITNPAAPAKVTDPAFAFSLRTDLPTLLAGFAFIGLERVGGIVVYEVTDPRHARFVQYLNNRDFSVADAKASVVGDGAVGDLGPDGQPLLVVGNEVSGTTTLYRFALP